MENPQFALTEYESKVGKGIKEYLERTGITQSEFVERHKNIVNKGYLNAMILQKKVDGEGVYPKIHHYKKYARIIGMEDNDFWQHIETDYYNGIIATCHKAQEAKELRLIDGQEGYCKTYSLERYWQSNNGVAYVKMKKKWNKKTFLQAIATNLNIKKADTYSVSAIQDKIVEVLTKDDTNWLLILDEMEQASKSMWVGVIKDLIDDTQAGSHERLCGLIICGSGINEKVSSWTDQKTAKQGANQLWDRLFGSWQLLESLKENKHSILYWRSIIKISLDNTGIEIENETDVIDWLTNLNTMRSLSKVVVRACQYSTKNNKPISVNMLDRLFGKELSYGE